MLEPEQHEKLAEFAQQENRSISDLVREIVRDWLSEQDDDKLWQQRIQAINEMHKIREQIESEYGIHNDDITDEIRAERDDDFARV